jgi:hypothetical protein
MEVCDEGERMSLLRVNEDKIKHPTMLQTQCNPHKHSTIRKQAYLQKIEPTCFALDCGSIEFDFDEIIDFTSLSLNPFLGTDV